MRKLKFLETSFLLPARALFFVSKELDFDFEKTANGWDYLERNFYIDRSSVLLPIQKHTSYVLFDEEPFVPSDGVFTSDRKKVAGVLTADCVPILIRLGNKAIGTVHAGWRGLKDEIVRKAIKGACEFYKISPEEVFVSMGPSAGICCYEVKEDLSSIFYEKGYGCFIDKRNKKFYLDLKLISKNQCEKEGVKKIEVIDRCTICDKNFHSWRRKSTGKMLNLIFFPILHI